jgi:hypothetical protein
MQKVEIYYNIYEAKDDMEKHIKSGWKIHTCTTSCYTSGYDGWGRRNVDDRILVVYENNDT